MINEWQANRREFLTTAASGLGGVALTAMLSADGVMGTAHADQQTADAPPLALKMPHFTPRAKSCIFIFMEGAPSQLELFHYRPELERLDGQPIPSSLTDGVRFAFIQKETAALLAPRRKFSQHGASGMWFSDALPQIATCADDICMIHTMHTPEFNHHPGQLFMQCGQARFGLPSMGAWMSYGLGTVNQDLPSYVVLYSGRGPSGGATLYSSGHLPSVHGGVLLRNDAAPILNLENPPGIPQALQRKGLDALRQLNLQHHARVQDPEILNRIANYELAFRMQAAAPSLTDFSDESASTLEAYGVNRVEPTGQGHSLGNGAHFKSFATNCLLARRLVERGVRFVNIIVSSWDHHEKLDTHLDFNARVVDQPIATMITDLKQRGLLSETLVVWGSEFGRTPLGENRPSYAQVSGRDHHPNAFSIFLAGGGVRGGYVHGETDDIGWNPIKDAVHVNDFQATLLHLFGIDHLRLTHRHEGADARLTNITRESRVVQQLFA